MNVVRVGRDKGPKAWPNHIRSPKKAQLKTVGYYISEQDAPKVVRAIEHYAAYMRATNRDDRPYSELAMSLQPFGCCVPNLAFPHSKLN